jgi:hypothetical protein
MDERYITDAMCLCHLVLLNLSRRSGRRGCGCGIWRVVGVGELTRLTSWWVAWPVLNGIVGPLPQPQRLLFAQYQWVGYLVEPRSYNAGGYETLLGLNT